ncbi:hypothetical protein NL676_037046 [Syzygium grande]|nr:hypothetical protein NL676_037046 [Syzygium grande]
MVVQSDSQEKQDKIMPRQPAVNPMAFPSPPLKVKAPPRSRIFAYPPQLPIFAIARNGGGKQDSLHLSPDPVKLFAHRKNGDWTRHSKTALEILKALGGSHAPKRVFEFRAAGRVGFSRKPLATPRHATPGPGG